jgi:hypothetical protein
VVVTTGGLGFGGGGGAGTSVVVTGGTVVVVVVVAAADVVVGLMMSGACGLGASVPQAANTSEARMHSGIRRLVFKGAPMHSKCMMHTASPRDRLLLPHQNWNVIPRGGERGV